MSKRKIKRYQPEGFEEPRTVLDALRVGRAILAEEGRWIKNTAYRLLHPEEDPGNPFCDSWGVCSIGALQVNLLGAIEDGSYVSGWAPMDEYKAMSGLVRPFVDDKDDLDRRRNLYRDAVRALDVEVKKMPGHRDEGIVGYNDGSATHEEVMAVWDRAIATEEAKAHTHKDKDGVARYVPAYGQPAETVVEALTYARDLLLEEGRWTKQHDFRNPENKAGVDTPFCNSWSACARGAVWVCTAGMKRKKASEGCTCSLCVSTRNRMERWELAYPNSNPVYTEALALLDQAAHERDKHLDYKDAIVALNDRGLTTRDDVIDVFNRALQLAEEKQNA